jgi:hypothetical protein
MERRKFIQISTVAGSTLASFGGLLPLGGGSLERLSMSSKERRMLGEYEKQFNDAPHVSELSPHQKENEINPKRVLRFQKNNDGPFSYVNGNGKTVTLKEVKGHVIASIK